MAAGSQARSLPHAARARQVWIVIVMSTVLFCLVLTTGGLGIYRYLGSLTRSEHADMERIRGSQLLVVRHLRIDPEAVVDSTVLNEGDRVITGPDTEANLDLFDTGTAHLYFGTTLVLDKLRTSRFLSNSEDVSMNVVTGTLVLSTPAVNDYSQTDYTVTTRHAVITPARNSTIRVQVDDSDDPSSTQVIVTFGSAEVRSGGGRVVVNAGDMTTAAADSPPGEPHAAEQDLIRNGDFKDPATSAAETTEYGGLGVAAWMPIREQSPDANGATSTITPSVVITTENPGGQPITAAVISRNASDGKYGRAGLRQDINAPASFLKYIELRATIKVVDETTPVSGPQGDVFPLTIRVIYTDPSGKQQFWDQAFAYGTEIADDAYTSQVNQGAWMATWRLPNPSKFVLKQLQGASPGGKFDSSREDIAVIDSVEIFGVGTKFQSWISDISLIAR